MSHFRFILFGLLTLCLSACPTIAPTITVQPRSLTVVVGSTATFSVTATGSEPFIYQWQKTVWEFTQTPSRKYCMATPRVA